MFLFSRRLQPFSALLGVGAAALLAAASDAAAQALPSPDKKVNGSLPAAAPTAASETLPPLAAPKAVMATAVAQDKEAGKKDAPAACTEGCGADPGGNGFDWLKNPKPAFIQRPGFFAVPPTGPGYYSLLDMFKGNYRESPPPGGYPRFAIDAIPFFDADFRCVEKPGYEPDLLERLHRVHVGDNWLFATGGEFRFRYYNEVNSRLSGKDNRYELTRLRIFGDVWYQDRFRIYVEGINAQDFNYNKTLAPNLIDRNNTDLLNAFIDVKLWSGMNDVPWYVRGGRQELVLGSQRLISALDWANTRRTFDGFRVFRHGEKFDVDAFWTRPVIPNPSEFDIGDPRQNFAGVWTEYRPSKTQSLDLYYLYLNNNNRFNLTAKTPPPVGQFPVAPYNVSTLGYCYSGNTKFNKNILFDFENAIQFGNSNFANAGLVAGSTTTGLGYNFAQVPMNPTFWAYFDYATGSQDLKSGQLSTFNQLYPFGHYYFGGIDYIGRQNITDWNFHTYLYPVPWITLNAQFHVLTLASPTDALYNSAGQILRYDPTGKAGRTVGEELTFVSNFHLTPRQDIFVAYAYLFEGRFLQATGPGRSAATLWLMYNFRW